MNHSPLSFSQNIHNELSVLVRDALSKLGVPDLLLNDFDSHSTISIDLGEEKSINISVIDDRLFIWSFILMSEELLIDNARSIMPVITTAIDYVETSHLTLGKCNDGFELKALINPLALAENKFSQVINDFYSALKMIHNHM
ncbi:MAG: type secretion system chaperone SpaK [Pseudomonadota bacterium]|jgi:type III secretion system chaperone